MSTYGIKKKSASMNDIASYRLENFQKSVDDMTIIIDNIRNYREVPPDILERITFMTNEQKMTIIREFNRIVCCLYHIIR
jgi:hypothetical protein